jgi:hypothetical protein
MNSLRNHKLEALAPRFLKAGGKDDVQVPVLIHNKQ